MSDSNVIHSLTPGMPLLYGGNKTVMVSPELAERFRAGDRLLVVAQTGDILHIPATQQAVAADAVGRAAEAFTAMGSVDEAAVSQFYELFAQNLENDSLWSEIAAANAADVQKAGARGRSTTRLVATEKMRRDMIAGLRTWKEALASRGRVLERVAHDGWTVEQVVAPLGVVGFVFEGRPNVFADATGVLRSGNTTVLRIGSDALGTARAIMNHALRPALHTAGLPEGAVVLIDSTEHAAGWAMFSDSRLGLAIARGSGRTVEQLGSVARQSGIPVSLHGTGGAWIIADETAPLQDFSAAVYHSLDRKVCNTLNVCCLPRQSQALIAEFIATLERVGERDSRGYKLHMTEEDKAALPAALFTKQVSIRRAEGAVMEPQTETLPVSALGKEWEWEGTPEVTLTLVDSTDEAITLFNHHSPQFIGSLISTDPAAQQHFYETINAPFVGNGFTRWVDGQYALDRPELGLSNWQNGRLFARSGILSGDGIYTVRTRVTQTDPQVHR